MTHYPISADTVARKIAERIEEDAAELKALEAVAINTGHKKLTNAAIHTDGDDVAARIDDYLSFAKALYVSYSVNHADGRTSYHSRDINAYTYKNPDGSEIGTEGIQRISRTMTPAELEKELGAVIEGKRKAIAELRRDLKRAATITRQYNAIEAKRAALLDSVTYATRRALEGR